MIEPIMIDRKDGFSYQERTIAKTVFHRSFYKDPYENTSEDASHIKNIIEDEFMEMCSDIFKAGLHTVESSMSLAKFQMEYRICLNVLRPKIQFANVNDDVFKVNGVSFSNDELVEAVKDYYAERLI
jgi:hypothetical protein